MALFAKREIDKGKQVILMFNFVPSMMLTIKFLEKLGIKDYSIIIGGQERQIRQANIDNYQNGKTRVLLATLKSGGDCLNLHHDRKAGSERSVGMPVTWSTIDWLQGIGRAARITSLTPTTQRVFAYRGTIEERVIAKLQAKNCSLAELVGRQASLADLFMSEFGLNNGERITAEMAHESAEDEDMINEETFETGATIGDDSHLIGERQQELGGVEEQKLLGY